MKYIRLGHLDPGKVENMSLRRLCLSVLSLPGRIVVLPG